MITIIRNRQQYFVTATDIFCYLLLILMISCNGGAPKISEPAPDPCNPALPESAPGYPDPYANLPKGDWSFIGPYDWGSRVICLAISPDNPYHLYAGSASGGLWVNKDTRTQGWQWVNTDTFKVLGVAAIAIQPNNPKVIYIGTGEVYNYNNTDGGFDQHKNRGSYGIGILYSSDQGKSWKKAVGLPNIKTLGVQDIEMAPNGTGMRIWAATTEGVYKSDDGVNFSKSLNQVMVTDISVHPTDPNQVVAAVGNLNTPNAGIYTSKDGGNTWKCVVTRAPSEFMGKTEFARAPSDPNTIFAVMGTWNPLYFANNQVSSDSILPVVHGDCVWPNTYPKTSKNWVYGSTDGGNAWSLIQDATAFSSGQGHYSMCVTVDPSNKQKLLLGGIAPIYQSTDGGKTISGLNNIKGSSGLNSRCLPEAMGSFDVHQILFEPKVAGLIYVCSDQGVYMSEDGLKTIHRINRNLAIMQFYPHVASSQNDLNILFGCAQDYGPGCVSYMGINQKIGRGQWQMIYGFGHEAGTCAYDDKNDVAYMTVHMGSMIARCHLKSTVKIDNPDTSANYANGAFNFIPDFSPFGKDTLCSKHTSWNAPIAFSPKNPDLLYAAKDIIYTSRKQAGEPAAGKHWVTPDSKGTGLDGNPILKMLVSPEDEMELFVATAPRYKDMHLFHSKDGGATWVNITGPNLPKNRNPSSITQHPTDKNTLYLTVEGYGPGRVWKGTVSGGNWVWTSIEKGLPDTFTRAFAVDASNPNHLFVATDYGVFKSEDGGSTWSQFSSGLPFAIEGVQLIVYGKQRKLRLVSHGNGVWERSI
ncbi:MAG: hypothetical protein H7246_04760 [Phycisphaerae bacterium]|nr:hypothetical protein [Saprospiraceae bacterium]